MEIKQILLAPPGLRAVFNDEGHALEIPVIALALCVGTAKEGDSEYEFTSICGVMAGGRLDLCEEPVDDILLCFYLSSGEKLTAALKKQNKLK